MTRRMVRRAPVSAADLAQRSLQKFVGEPSKKRKRQPLARGKRHECIAEVRRYMKTKDWSAMTPTKLVALYWICHEMVYEVAPVELDKAKTWQSASFQAGRMVKIHFDGDMQMAIRFMQWAWTEEQRKEKWRRDNRRNGRRLTWQSQFIYDSLVTEWRSSIMRKRGG